MNVALTRGRHAVWVVCHAATLLQSKDRHWGQLLADASARGCLVNAAAHPRLQEVVARAEAGRSEPFSEERIRRLTQGMWTVSAHEGSNLLRASWTLCCLAGSPRRLHFIGQPVRLASLRQTYKLHRQTPSSPSPLL
jgi:hypothetical protein